MDSSEDLQVKHLYLRKGYDNFKYKDAVSFKQFLLNFTFYFLVTLKS